MKHASWRTGEYFITNDVHCIFVLLSSSLSTVLSAPVCLLAHLYVLMHSQISVRVCPGLFLKSNLGLLHKFRSKWVHCRPHRYHFIKTVTASMEPFLKRHIRSVNVQITA